MAQQDQELPVYVIQPGDTLTLVAARFGVSVDEILQVNDLADPNALAVGMEISIPGLDGVTGQLADASAGLGDTLEGMSKRYQLSKDLLVKLNRITSPGEIYTGVELIVPVKEESLKPLSVIEPGKSVLETAILNQKNPWEVLSKNDWSASWEAMPGDLVYLPAGEDIPGVNPISPLIQSISIDPLPLTQGATTEIKIKAPGSVSFTGSLSGKELHFFPSGEDEYVAFTGLDIMGQIGLTGFELHGDTDRGKFDYAQPILVQKGLYGGEQYVTVAEDLIDPKTIQAEDNQILPITSVATPERFFTDHFQYPVDEPCINGGFGVPRLYNGTYNYYHTGIDFEVCASNINIYAVASGKVVFNGPLAIKGNYTIIDHGWGVYSAYAHQSKFLVNTGDSVEAGQIIGEIGGTGRAAGPHLHWEIWVDGAYVNPLDWIEKTYP